MEPATGRTEAPLLGEPLPVELMNTFWADRNGIHDALRDAEGCERWLASVALLSAATGVADTRDGRLTERNAAELRRLRDAMRRLAATATADDRVRASSAVTLQQTAVDVLNDACAAAPIWTYVEWPATGRPSLVRRSSGSPFAVTLSTIAEAALRLFAGPERQELHACPAPGCVLYFVQDQPRRRWCSAGCGNRARVARHYQAHRTTTAT